MMKSIRIFILILASHELSGSNQSPKEKILENWWQIKNEPVSQNYVPISFQRTIDLIDDKKIMRIPETNFYSSVPNSVGVVGQGFLWIRELSAAFGTPIPILTMTLPMLLLGVGLVFIPDLTQLGLPLFYPGGGAPSEEATTFLPGLPHLSDLAELDFIKQATEMLPSGLTNLFPQFKKRSQKRNN